MPKGRRDSVYAAEDAAFLEAMRGDVGDPLAAEDTLFEESIGDHTRRRAPAAEAPSPAPRAPDRPDARPRAPEPEPQWLLEEDALFERAVLEGRVPRKPKRASSEPEPSPRGIPARRTLVRLLRTGELQPERTLDLHGLAQDGARAQVGAFVRSARAAGLRIVLIITGRGNHSAGDPVLRSKVPVWLRDDVGESVHDVIRAPVLLGSEGAFVVVLRPGS